MGSAPASPGPKANKPGGRIFSSRSSSSMLRVDLTPAFKSPYSDFTYNSPWFHNNRPCPVRQQHVRTYTNATDYTRLWAGRHAQIAVMGRTSSEHQLFRLHRRRPAGRRHAGQTRRRQRRPARRFQTHRLALVARAVGENSLRQCDQRPERHPAVNGTPWPFIWGGNFAGGRLDTSGTPLAAFDDSSLGGTGPTSALTQFARCTAAYLRGFQNAYHVRFYAVEHPERTQFRGILQQLHLSAVLKLHHRAQGDPRRTGQVSGPRAIQLMGPKICSVATRTACGSMAAGVRRFTRTCSIFRTSRGPAGRRRRSVLLHPRLRQRRGQRRQRDSDRVGLVGERLDTSPAAGIPANVHGYSFTVKNRG